MMLVEREACCHEANAFLSGHCSYYLAHIQAENVQNVHFWQKAPGVNGLVHLSLLISI